VLQGARPELTEDQKAEIKEAFELFDSEKSGKLDYHELKVAMRALGFPVKKEDVRKILADYDKESAGKIAYDDFLEVSKYENALMKRVCKALRQSAAQ
jgi:centrin-3